ncbi:MAG TPA: hypothetical protein VFI93_11735 [Rhizomicrobium sp.]|nr:hypothetical protein [Rhizomicrobium sp.]
MATDPVVELMNQLFAAYDALTRIKDRRSDEALDLMKSIATFQALAHVTEPTSMEGAAYLLREAAALLLRTHVFYHGERLRRIANRLSHGQREFGDLLELRAIIDVVSNGVCGTPREDAAALIENALKGAARPVVVVDTPHPRGRLRQAFGTDTPHMR